MRVERGAAFRSVLLLFSFWEGIVELLGGQRLREERISGVVLPGAGVLRVTCFFVVCEKRCCAGVCWRIG